MYVAGTCVSSPLPSNTGITWRQSLHHRKAFTTAQMGAVDPSTLACRRRQARMTKLGTMNFLIAVCPANCSRMHLMGSCLRYALQMCHASLDFLGSSSKNARHSQVHACDRRRESKRDGHESSHHTEVMWQLVPNNLKLWSSSYR